MSELEALQKVINDLGKIPVPVELTMSIGIPIMNARGLLQQIYDAVTANIQKEEEAKHETE